MNRRGYGPGVHRVFVGCSCWSCYIPGYIESAQVRRHGTEECGCLAQVRWHAHAGWGKGREGGGGVEVKRIVNLKAQKAEAQRSRLQTETACCLGSEPNSSSLACFRRCVHSMHRYIASPKQQRTQPTAASSRVHTEQREEVLTYLGLT